MRITSAEWVLEHGHPKLIVTTADGTAVRIWSDQKPAILEQDIVCIDAPVEWTMRLPDVEARNEDGDSLPLGRGFIRDPLIAALTAEFLDAWHAGTFAPQQIDLDRRV